MLIPISNMSKFCYVVFLRGQNWQRSWQKNQLMILSLTVRVNCRWHQMKMAKRRTFFYADSTVAILNWRQRCLVSNPQTQDHQVIVLPTALRLLAMCKNYVQKPKHEQRGTVTISKTTLITLSVTLQKVAFSIFNINVVLTTTIQSLC